MQSTINDAIKKRDEMIASNLEKARQNECVLRENSLEQIIEQNKDYIKQSKQNNKYNNYNKNKVLETLFQNLKDR